MKDELNRIEAEEQMESTTSRFTEFAAYIFVILVMLFLFVKIVFF